ncbi:MAG: tRNA pseudouridine(38-40) synthase TruA [Ignavibacteriaceae bacterium]|nr:tRNA pseudouridine(38-40) synthase TruA [Ignavibacteriaceae bacterium]NUM70887.1 tRNA pseudouridine(38-40) synthase TruA [Ignavibacteriaceae bacterium]
MPNYRLDISYDGGEFCGWQIQKQENSVQGTITRALEILFRHKINLIGAGRTDAGVHALGQVANFTSDEETDTAHLRYKLNSIVPRSIAVKNVSVVPGDFNARFSAKTRVYYYIITGAKSPFFYKYAVYMYNPLNLSLLNSYSELLAGKRDYASFTKQFHKNDSNICDIISAQWRKKGSYTIFRIEANRFLHGMVRTIVGTQLMLQRTEESPEVFGNIIEGKDRKLSASSAPAHGLFLYKVTY